ncbi:MAG: DUF2029 domain-containing protein [Thermanaerothrix sp.]|nr:DUF2029 domain-containing protein [Thermanaerothrix sp.]
MINRAPHESSPLQRTPWAYLGVGLLVLLTLVALTEVNYRFALDNPGGNDFLARWMGAHMWLKEGLSPYDERVSLASQVAIYGRPADASRGEDIAHFVYPFFSMLFFAPFGLFDYPLARALWMTLLEIALVALVPLSLHLAGYPTRGKSLLAWVLFNVLGYIGVRTIVLGQFAGLNALLIVTGLALIYHRHDVAAGFLLALSASKPQMTFLLLPMVLLWALSTRRWHIVASLLGGLAGLMLSSLALLPTWPQEFLRQLAEYPSYTNRVGSVLSIVAGLFPALQTSLNLLLHAGFVLLLGCAWRQMWGKGWRDFLYTALLTLSITNFIAPRTATPHYAALLPAVFLIFRALEARWRQGGTYAVWGGMLFLFVGHWVLFLTTLVGNMESAWMYLPLPCFCLIGLLWARRWWLTEAKP